MLTTLRDRSRQLNLLTVAIALAVLALAFLLGQRASVLWLALLLAGFGGFALLYKPYLGLPALVAAALVMPLNIGTGTEVSLNAVTLLIPVVAVFWLLEEVRRGQIRIVSSPVNRPLMLFLLANLISLIIGRATWDPLISINSNFLLVQLAQWGIFVLSALAFWMTANLVNSQTALWQLTGIFLLLAGGLAILRAVPGAAGLVEGFTTIAFIRAPLWILLAAVAGGQLLWNRQLSLKWQLFLVATLLAALLYAFVQQQEAASNWVGLGAVFATLLWLRFPRLRGPALLLIVVLAVTGVAFPAVYRFAGGDAEWALSGDSRLTLIQRVVEVTMRNPVTGLGPAAYRPYANATPLVYENIFWIDPRINSHNNYVDLFAHGGILSLALFAWFAWEIARLGARLRRCFTTGFAAAYVNGVLAAGAGALVVMALADWILPFVYNIGFPGFQASVLVWLFMGGLVVLEGINQEDIG